MNNKKIFQETTNDTNKTNNAVNENDTFENICDIRGKILPSPTGS